ncbi:type III effector protein [Streptomyces sp. NPDC001185]|uniref:type III effector protein n=1 Tax=Streptomyces sp. NPDC001185 TaxID=3154380 RepID=UPI00332F4F79
MSDNESSAPTSFEATATALEAIAQAMRTARSAESTPGNDAQQAIAALLLLREVREQLADWEPALIETARQAGASWADLAHPLGVSSRQAAERRYLRVRPGEAGHTKEQRVQATRHARAADRSVASWAQDHASALRQLAAAITALPDLPDAAADTLTALHTALGDRDPARLLNPLSDAGPHLRTAHPDLADRVADVGRHTDGMRESERRQRSSSGP